MAVDPTAPGDLADRAAQHRALGDPNRLAMADALVAGDLTPGELGALTGLAANHLAFHLRVLERAGVVATRRSEGDARRRYVTLLVEPGLGTARVVDGVSRAPRRPLFVCTRNAARSQLAAALWREATGRAADSAGTEPADVVDPRAVRVAAARGLDLGGARPRHLRDVAGRRAGAARPDLVVSVCDRAHETPMPFDAPVLHWSVPDPAGRPLAAYRAALAELDARVARLAARTGAAVAA